jgi:hypothetical protein
VLAIWFARAAIVSWATTGGVDTAVMAIASMMTAVMPSADAGVRRPHRRRGHERHRDDVHDGEREDEHDDRRPHPFRGARRHDPGSYEHDRSPSCSWCQAYAVVAGDTRAIGGDLMAIRDAVRRNRSAMPLRMTRMACEAITSRLRIIYRV